MSRTQSELLRQLEERSSSRSSGQEGIRQQAGAALSDEDQAVLDNLLGKADADPDNAQSSKDYSKNLLEELAGWLKRQAHYPGIRSLQDLSCPANRGVNLQEMEKKFIADGAPPLIPIEQPHSNFSPIIEALRQLSDEPPIEKIKLPISPISRRDEKLLHNFRTVFRNYKLNQGMPEHKVNLLLTLHIRAFKLLLNWLHEKPAFRETHGLDSLEKLYADPDEDNLKRILNRIEVKMARQSMSQSLTDRHIRHSNDDVIKMVRRDGIDTDTSERMSIIKRAVQALRELRPRAPSPAESRTMQPAPRQQPSVQPDQPSDPSSPYYLSTLGFDSDDIDLIKQTFPGAFANQLAAAPPVEHAPVASTSGTQPHGVSRPASPSQDEPPAVRRRLEQQSRFSPA